MGHFLVKTLVLPSFALDAIWRSNLGLLHGLKRAHCAVEPPLTHTKLPIQNYAQNHAHIPICEVLIVVEREAMSRWGFDSQGRCTFMHESTLIDEDNDGVAHLMM